MTLAGACWMFAAAAGWFVCGFTVRGMIGRGKD